MSSSFSLSKKPPVFDDVKPDRKKLDRERQGRKDGEERGEAKERDRRREERDRDERGKRRQDDDRLGSSHAMRRNL
jgi:hypothetical protein